MFTGGWGHWWSGEAFGIWFSGDEHPVPSSKVPLTVLQTGGATSRWVGPLVLVGLVLDVHHS